MCFIAVLMNFSLDSMSKTSAGISYGCTWKQIHQVITSRSRHPPKGQRLGLEPRPSAWPGQYSTIELPLTRQSAARSVNDQLKWICNHVDIYIYTRAHHATVSKRAYKGTAKQHSTNSRTHQLSHTSMAKESEPVFQVFIKCSLNWYMNQLI